MNVGFYQLIPVLSQEELNYLFNHKISFSEFKRVITSNKLCDRFYKDEEDLKLFYLELENMDNDEDEVCHSVSLELEDEKTIQNIQKKIDELPKRKSLLGRIFKKNNYW